MNVRIQSAQELGQAIRAQRKQRKLTQAELAEYCGCSAKFINQLERGKPTVQLDKVLSVAMTLGCDLHMADRRESFK